MIPLFDSNGNLPPGIYSATLLEIEKRFVYNAGIKLTAELKQILENIEASKQKYLGDIFIRFPEPPFYFDHVIEWQKDRDGNAKGIVKLLIESKYD